MGNKNTEYKKRNKQNNTMTPEQSFSQSALLDALMYVANESQKSPHDCVRDICNEAFDTFDLLIWAKWSDDPDRPISFQI
jgi:hypothetical protein